MPILRDIAIEAAELQFSGEELQAIFVEMDLPEFVITGEGRVHITYQGENAAASQSGYPSLPAGAVKGLSIAEAEELLRSTKNGGDVSTCTSDVLMQDR
ncbi:hypothetical protein [Novipirellula sp.]|uniref:hypothetical protein n=1 Tax=Novipirellula sp. TaxID=2795430 RepID=UPI003564EA64